MNYVYTYIHSVQLDGCSTRPSNFICSGFTNFVIFMYDDLCLVLAWCLVPITNDMLNCILRFVYGTWCLVPGARVRVVLGAWYLVPGAWCLVPGASHYVFVVVLLMLAAWFLEPAVLCLMPATWCL